MIAFVLFKEIGKFKMYIYNISRPSVEGLATWFWVATHYLRIPGLIHLWGPFAIVTRKNWKSVNQFGKSRKWRYGRCKSTVNY